MSVNKTIIGLLILVAGMSYYLYQKQPNGAEHEMFIPELSANEAAISSLSRVTITQGDQRFDLHKKDGDWLLNGGFYVRMDSLFIWVQALKNARLIESKTANPENFEQLELTDRGLRIRLYSTDDMIADVVIGKKGAINGARFARYYDDNQSWLVSELTALQSSPEMWSLTLIFDVPENKVQAIEWTADEKLDLIKNNETGKWQLMDTKNKALQINEDSIKKLTQVITSFRIKEALPETVVADQFLQSIAYGLDNGRKITLAVYKNSEDYVITLKDSQQSNRFKNWQFTVPDHKLDSLLMNQEALTMSKEVDGNQTEEHEQPTEVDLPVQPSS